MNWAAAGDLDVVAPLSRGFPLSAHYEEQRASPMLDGDVDIGF